MQIRSPLKLHDMVKINGSSFALQYKRTTSRPIDSTDVFDTIEDARVYARNTDTEPYVPYAGQIITVEERGSYLLVKDDTIPESDGKKHFKLVALGNKNDTDDSYLSKVNEDTARELIHFLKGIDANGVSNMETIILLKEFVSKNFSTGSTGFGIYQDESGNYHLDIDFVNIRRKLTADSIQVQRTYYVGGKQYVTPGAGIICSSVEDLGTEWRCRFKTTDADGRIVHNTFEAGDLGICETFNLEKKVDGKLGNRYYWRLVTGKGADYITLSKSDCDTNSDTPLVGDEIVQLGNRTDKNRQGAVVMDSVTAGGPYIRVYKGINSYNLPKPKIDLNPEQSVIESKLISEATGKDVDESLNTITKEIAKIKEQSDKSFTIWMEAYMPTLENEPASLWTDAATRDEHEQDIFYNTSAKTGEGGRAFRYENNAGVYSWNEITDKDTLAALEQALAADKKADSKKRVFVDTPNRDSVYDIGDLWVNAVYDDGTTIYKNDSLVCITAKVKGEAFSISHWKPTSTATTAYLENLGNKIVIAVTDSKEGIESAKRMAEQGIKDAAFATESAFNALGIAKDAQGKADENAAAIVVMNDSITALVQGIHFDRNGNITNINTSGLVTTADFNTLLSKKITFDASGHVSNISTSGLVTEAEFAQMFSEKAMADGYVKRAEISTFITEDDAGRLISNATIKADNINFEGSTVKISANNIELNGDVIAKAIKLDGLNVNDKFVIEKDGTVKMTGELRAGGDSEYSVPLVVDSKGLRIGRDGFDNVRLCTEYVSNTIESTLELGSVVRLTKTKIKINSPYGFTISVNDIRRVFLGIDGLFFYDVNGALKKSYTA